MSVGGDGMAKAERAALEALGRVIDRAEPVGVGIEADALPVAELPLAELPPEVIAVERVPLPPGHPAAGALRWAGELIGRRGASLAARAWFAVVVAAYIRELRIEGVRLADELVIAAVLDDLCRLAEVPPPPDVARVIGERE